MNRTNVDCMTRKRIWEVDCLSLDAALAASFDWRELVNLLQGHGHEFDFENSEALLEMRAQCLIHEHCHSENEVSICIEDFLNDWHQKTIQMISEWRPSQVAEYVLTTSFDEETPYGGLFWALGSDSRQGFDCIRRRFHQRFQIFSLRRLQS